LAVNTLPINVPGPDADHVPPAGLPVSVLLCPEHNPELLDVIITLGELLKLKVVELTAGTHGAPFGLLVVNVNVTVLPASDADGVYIKENGEVLNKFELTEPNPL
jgi:hypothetical protein